MEFREAAPYKGALLSVGPEAQPAIRFHAVAVGGRTSGTFGVWTRGSGGFKLDQLDLIYDYGFLMKRVIRSRSTGEFVADNSAWTKELRGALMFPDLASAMAFRDGLGLRNVELVLVVGEEPNSIYDVVLPLLDAGASAPRASQ